MRVALASTVASKEKCRAQFAALPWRTTNGSLEILLITTLRTQRWIVPKGWPIEELAPKDCAAREALEEAGVSGTISEKPIGSFRYFKQRKSGEVVPCKVDVFALEVRQQRRTWAEKGARQYRWCSVAEALACVGEPGLRQIINRFTQAQKALAN
jgi:8-oxo-dGTP pyrophosphatase MutT (NUDIX family)